MKKQNKYTDEPMNTGKVVKDFLPSPQELVFKKQRVVTLRLDESTANRLQEVAEKKGLGISTLSRMWLMERLADEGKENQAAGSGH